MKRIFYAIVAANIAGQGVIAQDAEKEPKKVEQQQVAPANPLNAPTMGDLRRIMMQVQARQKEADILSAEVNFQAQQVALKQLRNQAITSDTEYLRALEEQASIAQRLGVQIVDGQIVPLPTPSPVSAPSNPSQASMHEQVYEEEPEIVEQPALSPLDYPTIKSAFCMTDCTARLKFPDGSILKVAIGDVLKGLGEVTLITGSSVVIDTPSNQQITLTYRRDPKVTDRDE